MPPDHCSENLLFRVVTAGLPHVVCASPSGGVAVSSRTHLLVTSRAHAIEGDQAKADLIATFMQMRGRLKAIARSIVGRSELAEEVLQDAYVKLSQLTEMPGVARPDGYCAQTVRNLAMDCQRRFGTESTYRIFVEDAESVAMSPDAGPDRMLGLRQALEEIDRVLRTLSPRTRQAFELYRLGEMTQRDIGKRLGCSAWAVNTMLKEADEALRACRHLLE